MCTEMHTFLMKRATHVGCVKPGVSDQNEKCIRYLIPFSWFKSTYRKYLWMRANGWDTIPLILWHRRCSQYYSLQVDGSYDRIRSYDLRMVSKLGPFIVHFNRLTLFTHLIFALSLFNNMILLTIKCCIFQNCLNWNLYLKYKTKYNLILKVTTQGLKVSGELTHA